MKKRLLLGSLVTLVYLLHQDFWNWHAVEPVVFGLLPIGLAYHVGFSILAAMTMAVLVRWAWPEHLEAEERSDRPSGKDAP